jgi:hypothetical protein
MAKRQQLAPSGTSQQDCSSRLPPELTERIGELLPSGREAAAFRSVCSTWRAAVPFSSFAPVVMLPFDPQSSDGAVQFYRVTDGEVFTKKLPAVRGKALCGSSHGWLVLVDKVAAMTLLNPFTGATAELPPPGEQIKLGAVVLSSPPGTVGCVAVAAIERSVMVAFCRVGVDRAWSLLGTNLKCCAQGIVHCCGRFLAIGYDGEISILDVASAAVPNATPVPYFCFPDPLIIRSYLQVNGELHAIGNVVRTSLRERTITYRTRVYKCDVFAAGTPVWSRVTINTDLTIFMSNNFMSSFGGASVPGLESNSLCFSEHLYGRPHHQLEIIKISNGRSQLLAYHPRIKGSEPLCWIKPNLWPKGKTFLLIPSYYYIIFIIYYIIFIR